MYEKFGFTRSASGAQSITLFIPDNTVDSAQYTRGSVSHIASITIVSDFQSVVNPGSIDWDPASALAMTQTNHPNGHLFVYSIDPPLPDGWYQYQYLVTFDDTTVRLVGDPCTKYGGDSKDRSAFVVGGSLTDAKPIDKRLPSQDLIIYELMIDDFTKEYRGTRAPIDAIQDKLDDVQGIEHQHHRIHALDCVARRCEFQLGLRSRLFLLG
jgi:pullulanase